MRALTSFSILLTLCACGSPAPAIDAAVPDDGGSDVGPGPRDWPEMAAPTSSMPLPGVLRDVVRVDVPAAPPNPTTSTPTPADLNRIQVLRFHAMSGAAPHAVVIAMPGFLGGAASFEGLARELVSESITAGAPIEVWAVDRRSNLLEDLRGADSAEVQSNPDIERGYYFSRETVGGHAFEGFLDQTDVPYMSEWGLETLVSDVHALIGHIAATDRIGHVFLMGHSLGGTFAETYAAWHFADGTRGASELAGVILIDGSQTGTSISETEYHAGTGSGLMAGPGIEAIRSTTRFFALPVLGVATYARADILSLEALTSPDAVVVDRGRNMLLSTLLGLSGSALPSMTNEAALGLAFDASTNGLTFAAVSVGQSAGGPLTSYTSILGPMLVHPSDPTATYTWVDAFDATPAEITPYAVLAHSWVDGPINFAEWYFPSRLPLDLSAVSELNQGATSWQAAQGLTASDGAAMDAPVLAIATELRTPADFEMSRARAAPIGPGRRVAAGTPRTDPAAFDILDAMAMLTHVDPVIAPASPRNPVPARVLAFVTANTGAGTTSPTIP